MLKTYNELILNVISIWDRPIRYFSPFLLISLLIVLIISPLAASSSFNLTAPEFMDVSGQDAFEVLFACREDAGGLSAGLLIPNGLQYVGNARVEMSGKLREVEPSLVGG